MPEPSSQDKCIIIIGTFKLLKATLLVAAGIGILKLLHKDIGDVVEHWIEVLRIDPDNRLVHSLLVKTFSVDDHRLKEIGVGTFCYAGVFLTEGSGLLLKQLWAQYFTVIVTGSFLPLEVYELLRHMNVAKIFVILINVTIVAYLSLNLRRNQHKRA